MSIKTFWDNISPNVFRVEMHAEWKWEEFTNAINKAHAIIAERDHDVHIVIGFYSKVPPGAALPHLTHASNTQPPNLRHTAILNQSDTSSALLIRSLIHTIDRVHHQIGPKFVHSMEAARAHFARLEDVDDQV